MASIVWRPTARRWYCYYYDGNHQHVGTSLKNAPRRQRLTKRERIAAKAEAEQIEDDHQRVPADEIDLETAAVTYLEDCRVAKKFQTFERYRSTLSQFVGLTCPGGRRVRLRNVSDDHVRQFRDHRFANHAATTVRNDLKAVSAFFAWCRQRRDPGTGRRWIEENPAETIAPPADQDKGRRHKVWPTDAQVQEILESLETQPDRVQYALALFGAYAGMRAGSILHLRCAHVDLHREVLSVYDKSKNPRLIPMHPRIVQFLLDWPLDGEMVFPSPYKATGQRRSPFALRLFNRGLRAKGYPFTHKALRHYFNDALRRHPSVSDATRLLVVGHEDLQTNRIYSNPSVEEARAAVRSLGTPESGGQG